MYNVQTMKHYNPVHSRPIELSQSTEAQTYGLFALAMALTVGGVHIGSQFAEVIYGAGAHIILLIAQLAIVFTAQWWMDKSPLNYLLFGLLPIFSGIAIAPFIHSVIIGYENGPSILMNALAATGFMSAAAAVFARTTSWNLGFMGKFLFFALLGLIGMGILQFFVPALRTEQFELLLSGAGVVIFALFTVYDMQRVQQMGQMGANPFMLALSLYLDIFNLFLYLLRFMLVLYGDRR